MDEHVRVDEDGSLQRWGRNLKTVAPALDEMARDDRRQEQAADAVLSAIAKLVTQGESELPADRSLIAELDTIRLELSEILSDSRAARIASLAQRAEQLIALYRRVHADDEARLEGRRGGQRREEKSDVSKAKQDT